MSMSADTKSPGRAAYEAYCGKTNWKSLATGADLPTWFQQKQEIRDAWEVAAEAAIAYFCYEAQQ